MRNRRRGVFFISVLFTCVVLAMLVGAALQSGVWGLKRGQNQSDVSAARRAAAGGVEYALARLRDDPGWKANTPVKITTINEPGFFVVEERGNVIGVMDCGGQISQFRIRFNYGDGGGGADGMLDPSPAMAIASPLVSLNNMLPSAVADVPKADGPGQSVPASPNVYTSIPGHSVFLVVEGRCGDWLVGADPANPNPNTPVLGGYSETQVETVYKVANANSGGTPAVGAAAGNFKATVGTSSKKDNLQLDSASGSQVGRLRSKATLTVTGGQSGQYNLLGGKGGGEYRSTNTPGASTNPDPKVVQKSETASDNLYPIPWSQVHTADGTNSMPAGTYVYWDDGSLHYFDMSLAQYSNFMADPLNHGNPGQSVSLPPTVVSSSSGSGGGLKAKLTVTGDTLVTAATNTTNLAVIPQKGTAGGPGVGGGAPSATTMATAITSNNSMLSQNAMAPTQYLIPTPAGYNFLDQVAQWSAGQGVGTYSGGNWNLPTGGALNNLGTTGAIANLQVNQVGVLATQISLYIAANPNNTNWPSFATAMSMSPATIQDEIPGVGSAARAQNIEIKFNPPSGGSATLTAPGDVTLASKISGNGASITAEGNLSLLGLGVDLSAMASPTEGVSLYSKKDVTISTYDKNSGGKYHDVSLKGVVYAWGNFKALMGDSSVSESNWGKLKLTGSMVAYGKDPADLTGPTTGGNIEVVAKEATMKYDPAYLLDFSNTLPANITMLRVRWSEN